LKITGRLEAATHEVHNWVSGRSVNLTTNHYIMWR